MLDCMKTENYFAEKKRMIKELELGYVALNVRTAL